MYLADILFRAYINVDNQSATEKETESINMLEHLPVSNATLAEIEQATANDHELKAAKHYIQNGWPDHKLELQLHAHSYFMVKEELLVQDDIVFKGQQIVIPSGVRNY